LEEEADLLDLWLSRRKAKTWSYFILEV